MYQLSGLVVECPSRDWEVGGSIPRPGIPKIVKMGPNTSLLVTQQKGLDWGVPVG